MVNVSTSLKKKDAEKLRTLMEAHGCPTPHRLLKNLIAGNAQLTSKDALLEPKNIVSNQAIRQECGVRDLASNGYATGEV